MMKKLKYILSVSLMLGGMTVASVSTQAADMESLMSDIEATDSNIGLYSQYVWRGQRQSVGALSVQGDVGWEHDSGVSANVWFATLGSGNVTEFDYTLDYTQEIGALSYSGGAIYYAYHNNNVANVLEIYASVSYELGSATLYYDTDASNIWFDISSGIELAELAVEGTLSYSGAASEFVNIAVSVSKEIEVDDLVLSPSFAYNLHLGSFDTPATPDALVFAINVSY